MFSFVADNYVFSSLDSGGRNIQMSFIVPGFVFFSENIRLKEAT